jgi:hypothetical protein
MIIENSKVGSVTSSTPGWHVALFVYYTPTLAIAQNMVAANMRASSAFVAAIVLGLVGTGLGPSLRGPSTISCPRVTFGLTWRLVTSRACKAQALG